MVRRVMVFFAFILMISSCFSRFEDLEFKTLEIVPESGFVKVNEPIEIYFESEELSKISGYFYITSDASGYLIISNESYEVESIKGDLTYSSFKSDNPAEPYESYSYNFDNINYGDINILQVKVSFSNPGNYKIHLKFDNSMGFTRKFLRRSFPIIVE